MPPPASNGFGANRVHSTMPSGEGSPDATPNEKGYPENTTPSFATPKALPDQTAAAANDEVCKKERRFRPAEQGIWNIEGIQPRPASTYQQHSRHAPNPKTNN
jgi:hypothetical protein